MKGHKFTTKDLPQRRRPGVSPERLDQWLKEQTERYRIVAIDPEAPEGKREIIAEELRQRALNKLSPKAKRIAGHLVRLSPEIRAEVIGAFTPTGDLIIPFKKA